MGNLELNGISKKYGQVVACDNIHLEISTGELFYLLGPSGCGKSTLLNIIAGHVAPDSGRVALNDIEITGLSASKRPIHTIFQNYALFPHMTVEENIAFSLRMRGEMPSVVKDKVLEMVRLVGLEGLQTKYPAEISGGQQQRVAIARAVINQPSVLLLDEPFGALDAKLKSQMQIELKNIQRNLKMTFLCVSHDQVEALSTADKVAVMSRGKIEQIGTPESIYCFPQSRFVAEFVGDSNIFEGEVLEANDGESLVRSDSGISLRMKEGLKVGERVVVLLRPERVRIGRGKGGDSDSNLVCGAVKEVIFAGPTAKLIIAANCGVNLRAEISIASKGEHPVVGDIVTLGWSSEDLIQIRR